MQSELPLNGARRDACQKERPVQRIPGAHLRIRQQRHAGIYVRRPVRQLARVQHLREVVLRTVLDVHRVRLNGGVPREQRLEVEQQNGRRQAERNRAGTRQAVPDGGGATDHNRRWSIPLPIALFGSYGRLILLFFLVLRWRAEGDGRFARVLVIVTEIDHVARAVGRAALATQGLRMHRQQILLGIAQADVLVVGGRFHVVQGKFPGESLGVHLDAQHARGGRVDPHGTHVGRIIALRTRVNAPVGTLTGDFEIVHLGHDAAGARIAVVVEGGPGSRGEEIDQHGAEFTRAPGPAGLLDLLDGLLPVDLDIAVVLAPVGVKHFHRDHVDGLKIGRRALALRAGDQFGADVTRQGFGELHGSVGRAADQLLILALHDAYRILVGLAADDRGPGAVGDALDPTLLGCRDAVCRHALDPTLLGRRDAVCRRLFRHILRLLARSVGDSAALQLGRAGVVGGGADLWLRLVRGGGRGGALQTRRAAVFGGGWRGLFGSVLGPRLGVVLPRVHHAVIALGGRAASRPRFLPVHVDRRHGGAARVCLGFHRHLVAQVEFGRFHLVAGPEELGLVGAPEIHHALVAELQTERFLFKYLQVAAEVGQRAVLVGRGGLAVLAGAARDREAWDGRIPATGVGRLPTRIATTGVATSGVATSGIDLRQGGGGHSQQ